MPTNQMPVGTIIQSLLTWRQFKQHVGIIAWNTRSEWAPCDGRAIDDDSLYFKLTNRDKLPDARGVFLRGLNQFDTDETTHVDTSQQDPDAGRFVGAYQADILGSHTHTGHGRITGNVTGSNGTHDCDGGGDKYNSDPNFPDRNVSVTIDAAGGPETRPKNITVYYYVKIN